jgi:hypothetical protein
MSMQPATLLSKSIVEVLNREKLKREDGSNDEPVQRFNRLTNAHAAALLRRYSLF